MLLAGAAWIAVAAPPRNPPGGPETGLQVRYRATPVEGAKLDEAGPFRLAAAWRLSGDRSEFGSFSGLAIAPGGALVAVSDRGMVATMPKPHATGSAGVAVLRPVVITRRGGHAVVDSEALAIGPDGREWIALENQNAIVRADPASGAYDNVRPDEMQHWPLTKGPESLARLADGRFIVVSEAREPGRDGTFAGLVFARDPILGDRPTLFHLFLPDGLRPVDIAQLPDGRLLVLGRDFGPLRGFSNALYLVETSAIAPARRVDAVRLANISGPGITDNMEGLAVERAADGTVVVWVLSDANGALALQQTILLKLEMKAGALRSITGSARQNFGAARAGIRQRP